MSTINNTDVFLIARGTSNYKVTAADVAAFTGGGGGGVTGVGVTAPITDTGTATAPIIGIAPATTSQAGSLSAADKTKIDNLPATIVAAVTGTAPIVIAGTASNPDVTIQLATAAEAAAGTDATKVMTPSVGVPKVLANMTGAAIIPGGDDTERAAITTPAAGMLRYNDTTAPSVMEYYDGAAWTDLATSGGGLGNWDVASGIGSGFFSSVAYGNGRYVAVGSTFATVSTNDGYTWSTPTTPFAGFSASAITFCNNVFVVINNSGAGAATFTSTDGITWNTGATIAGANLSPARIGGAGGTFVAAGTDNFFYTSTDGLNWTKRSALPVSTGVYAFAGKSSTEFVGVGKNASTLALFSSTDGGVSWTPTTIPGIPSTGTSLRDYAISYDGSQYLFTFTSNPPGLYSTVNGTSATQLFSVGTAKFTTANLPLLLSSVSVSGNFCAVTLSSDGGFNAVYTSSDKFVSDAHASFGFLGQVATSGTTVVGCAGGSAGLVTAKVL